MLGVAAIVYPVVCKVRSYSPTCPALMEEESAHKDNALLPNSQVVETYLLKSCSYKQWNMLSPFYQLTQEGIREEECVTPVGPQQRPSPKPLLFVVYVASNVGLPTGVAYMLSALWVILDDKTAL